MEDFVGLVVVVAAAVINVEARGRVVVAVEAGFATGFLIGVAEETATGAFFAVAVVVVGIGVADEVVVVARVPLRGRVTIGGR